MLREEITQILSKHNYYRSLFNVPQIEYDELLSEYSQHRANMIASEPVNIAEPIYGENVFFTSIGIDDISVGVDSWMSERYAWIQENNNWNEGLQHFSQCIWHNSSKLGIGKAYLENNERIVLVCNYYPAGNIIGQQPYSII